jgi:hypothetical protein
MLKVSSLSCFLYSCKNSHVIVVLMLWSSESTVINHSDILIYLTICNAIK